jgi:hypothetical protein
MSLKEGEKGIFGRTITLPATDLSIRKFISEIMIFQRFDGQLALQI